MAVDENATGASSSKRVPDGVVHTAVWFVILGATGLIALAWGLYGAVNGPGPNDIPGWAGLGIVYGVVAAVTGCSVAPIVIRFARRDRATLVLVRAARPAAAILPGVASNRTLVRSLRALRPAVPTTKSFLWSVDNTGLTMWQHNSTEPVLVIPWRDIESVTTASMPQGRARIAILRLKLASGNDIRIALRRRFGGITLMGDRRLSELVDTLEAYAGRRVAPGTRGPSAAS